MLTRVGGQLVQAERERLQIELRSRTRGPLSAMRAPAPFRAPIHHRVATVEATQLMLATRTSSSEAAGRAELAALRTELQTRYDRTAEGQCALSEQIIEQRADVNPGPRFAGSHSSEAVATPLLASFICTSCIDCERSFLGRGALLILTRQAWES